MFAILLIEQSGRPWRFRRGADVGLGACRCSACITAICAIIGSPPCSPISISTSAVTIQKSCLELKVHHARV